MGVHPRILLVPIDLANTAYDIVKPLETLPGGSTTDNAFIRGLNLKVIVVRHWQTSFGVASSWVVSLTKKLGGFGSAFFSFSQATLRPEIAGFAMAFSSISVVLNSLLLKRYVPPIEKQSASN
jgi:hypothetical protein